MRTGQNSNVRLQVQTTSGKFQAIGEDLLPAVREVFQTVVHKSPKQIIKAIPLSDNSV